MAEFEILAALDLRGGRVVRLREGDFERETAYSDDPVATATELVGQGIRWLHVVDLDGAREGRRMHAAVIEQVIAALAVAARVEVGGGIRDVVSAREVLDSGAARVVVGTAAIGSDLAGQLIESFGSDRVAVALDVRGGHAVGSGWALGTDAIDLGTVMSELRAQGVKTFEVTAIDHDGTLKGPDLELLGRVRAALPDASIIASGGIRSIEDLQAVRDLGCSGAIVGRAIYEGRLDVTAALEAL